MSRIKCRYYRNSFCYVCGDFEPVLNKRCKITNQIEKNYEFFFKSKIIQNEYSPGIICRACKGHLITARIKRQNLKILKPAEWTKPRIDHTNCFFCLFKARNTDAESSMIRPIFGLQNSNVNNLPKKLGRRKKFGRAKKVNATEQVGEPNKRGRRSKLNLTKAGKPRLKPGRKPGRKPRKATSTKVDLNDTPVEVTYEDFDLDDIDSLEDDVFESSSNNENIKINVSGDKERTCDCPSINIELLKRLLKNPKIIDQKSLDEYAINLRILQKSERSLPFYFNENKFFGDDCRIQLDRINFKDYLDQIDDISQIRVIETDLDDEQVDQNVQVNSDQSVQVNDNQNLQVNGNQNVQVNGNQNVQVNSDQNVQVNNDQNLQVNGNQNVQVNNDQNLQVNGNQNLQVITNQTELMECETDLEQDINLKMIGHVESDILKENDPKQNEI